MDDERIGLRLSFGLEWALLMSLASSCLEKGSLKETTSVDWEELCFVAIIILDLEICTEEEITKVG
jgi:hypothetical protein